MSTLKNIGDIAAHSATAMLWAGMAGIGARLGWQVMSEAASWEFVFGCALLLGSIIALFTCLVYWRTRERRQHAYAKGGAQSQREWIIPDILAVVAFGAAMAFS